MKRLLLTLALAALSLSAGAQTGTLYGSLNNFDAVNDTGVECHGFEIEVHGCHSREITYTYDWNHYGVPRIYEDSTDPANPICYVRYESKKNPDGSWASYTAIPAGPIAATDGHQFTNPFINFGGEHFGVGFWGVPRTVKYSWLIDDGAGNLMKAGQVNIGTPQFNYLPPLIVQQQVVAPAQVVAVIEPPEPIEVPVLEFGEPTWIKVITTQSRNNNKVELEDLVSEDPNDPNDVNWRNGEPDEVEVEWELLQVEFNKDDGGNRGKNEAAPEDLNEGDEVITRRYEFYKYIGPIDPESGEVETDSVGPDGIHGDEIKEINGVEVDFSTIEIVGDYIGAQMAAFDAAGQMGLIDHLQDGEINQPYVERSMVIGGTPPIVTTIDGALPEGMEFDVVTGILSGTPTESGIFNFTLHSTDAAAADVTMDYSLNILEAPIAQFTVTADAAPVEGGSVTGAGTFDEGANVSLEATPEAGYQFLNWTENEVEVSTSAIYEFALSGDRNLVANFELIPVKVYQSVDHLVSIVESGKTSTLNRVTRKITSVSTVTITNNSGDSIDAPLNLLVNGVGAGITMPEASGSPAPGSFNYDLGAKKGLATLLPGESATITIKFVYPMTTRLAYSLGFMGTAF
ncbi:MAG: putative Ig domain-containing protein [Candidatus Hydrogenedentes bacterium]|nr:putative Ig domain-containing protein [Candidatus Hydrogenedentota bacterium]